MTESDPTLFQSLAHKRRQRESDFVVRDCHDVAENYTFAPEPGEQYPKPTREELELAVGIIADELIRHEGVITFKDLGIDITTLTSAPSYADPDVDSLVNFIVHRTAS